MQRIQRGLLAGAFLRLLGHASYGLQLNESSIDVLSPTPRQIRFRNLVGPPAPARLLRFYGLALPLSDGSVVKVLGLNAADAKAFEKVASQAWQSYISEVLATIEPELQTLAQMVERLVTPRRYPAACLLEPFVARTHSVLQVVPLNVPAQYASPEQVRLLASISAFQNDPAASRRAAIDTFIEAELTALHDFFDHIESNPLTPEQRLAVVTDEDATLVLAGAGSGKTSVIVAKAAYLIHREIRQPQEILLMAFGAKAAEEMANRIEARSGRPVDAKTFHALGLGIIREVEGQAPALAPHASDDAQFRNLLRDILVDLIMRLEEAGRMLLQWFTEFFWPYKNEWNFKTHDEYYRYVEEHELRTLNGELVRSCEELEIANWLYLNGITYEYEPTYEHLLPENDRRTYTPDFRLTESGIYIEHFGVGREVDRKGTTKFTTASYVDRKSYLEGMEWKRGIHKKYGTTLIETYSYERFEGRLTEALDEKLAPYATPDPIPTDRVLARLLEQGWADSFTQTLGTFLRHFKSSGLSIDECRERGKHLDDRKRGAAFLTIFEAVFTSYQKRLGDRIDFEDMINRATEHVRTGRYKSPYRHLLVDEFQDISEGRAALLRALKEQYEDARIFAVGDDWQSIYRFSGSDIHLMRHFGEEFGGNFAESTGVHQTVDLGRTFRSVDRIALPARRFVLQNPSQLRKEVVPAGKTEKPALTIAYYAPGQEEATLNTILLEIAAMPAPTPRATQSVLLLGRYRFLCPGNLETLQDSYPKLTIRFMTIHASKGLEADHVVILRAASGRLGLPSEIADDPLLDMVMPEPEGFDHAEERRVFYVALTRARRTVTILADQENPSVFVRELSENADYGAAIRGAPPTARRKCPSCGGKMVARSHADGRARFYCEHRFLCGTSLPACETCNKDLPRSEAAPPGTKLCTCGQAFPLCPSCDDGWLVKRKGPYSTFLGCVRYPDCRGTKRTEKAK